MASNGAVDKQDESGNGTVIDFVDILFALAIGEIIAIVPHWPHMPAEGRSQLLFVFVLTIGSWVGYHNSANRETGTVGFNLWNRLAGTSLGKLAIDVLLVGTYWWLAYDLIHHFRKPSLQAIWYAAVASASLYVLWDFFSYHARSLAGRSYFTWRRECSWLFLVSVVTTWSLAVVFKHEVGDVAATLLTSWLLTATVAYRVAKEIPNSVTKIRIVTAIVMLLGSVVVPLAA